MGELSAGSTGRRWIPDGGLQKYRERIHRESKFADEYKKLPFTFSKPRRPKLNECFCCEKCGYMLSAPKNTVMMICPSCKKVTQVVKVD